MNLWDFIKVVQALRLAQIPVSTQDLIDSLDSLINYPTLSSKVVLQTFLIHRPEDQAAFEQIWLILFNSSSPDQEPNQPPSVLRGGGLGIGLGDGGQTLNSGQTSCSARIGFPRVPQGFCPAQDLPDVCTSDERFTKLFQTALTSTDYYNWINSIDLSYLREEISIDSWQEAHNYATQFMDELRTALVLWQVDQENDWLPVLKQSWRLKPLQTLSQSERALVQAAIRQWGRKLAVHPGRRWKQSHSGRLDLAKTMQSAMQGGGRVFHLHHHYRAPSNPELVILCDVSNSVAPYVEFLLYLVSRLRGRFHKVRLFFFIDALWAVPQEFWYGDMTDWQEDIVSWGRKTSSGFSDYGKVLQEFASLLPDISTRATVLILGDGKNNFRPAYPEYLAQVKDSVRRVIWLNPLREEEWEERDNVVPVYRPFCTGLFRCRTVDDLQQIARTLM